MKRSAVALVLIGLLMITGCAETNWRTHVEDEEVDEIRSEIERANYCSIKEDCVRVEAKCPIGCEVYVNKEEESNIRNIFDSFKERCMYTCARASEIECRNNKCEPIF